jgi:4-hydroxythreonine-4-phosphate dehydrogenase
MKASPNSRAIVAVTMGDPVGVGPEIILKALMHEEIYNHVKPVVIGLPAVFRKVSDCCGLKVTLRSVREDEIANARYSPDTVNIIPIDFEPNIDYLKFGVPTREAAIVAYKAIEKAVDLALRGYVDAIATAPINKEEMRLAYPNFIGHTELLQELTDSPYALTMFVTENMRVFFLTRHVALRDVFKYVTVDNVVKTLIEVKESLEKLGIKNPRIAVAALNPHASDGGLFGDEEEKVLKPAIEKAKAMGIDAIGPVPADTVFWQARMGRYDAVLSLYHDQGHIATKTVDFYKTISVTLGLPFIRTSPDHGTAYSRAGKCTANEISMYMSIILAAQWGRVYRQYYKEKP